MVGDIAPSLVPSATRRAPRRTRPRAARRQYARSAQVSIIAVPPPTELAHRLQALRALRPATSSAWLSAEGRDLPSFRSTSVPSGSRTRRSQRKVQAIPCALGRAYGNQQPNGGPRPVAMRKPTRPLAAIVLAAGGRHADEERPPPGAPPWERHRASDDRGHLMASLAGSRRRTPLVVGD